MALLGSVAACGAEESDFGPATAPGVPALMPGQVMLAGRVADPLGRPAAGATVVVAETGQQVTAGDDGRYSLAVPADSTLSLQVVAPTFARTNVQSIEIPDGRMVANFDVLLVPSAEIEEYNAMSKRPGTGSGVVAVLVRSVSGNCSAEGARLSVFPSGAGTILYAGPSGAREPDESLVAMQNTGSVAAWLAGVIPGGGSFEMSAEKPSCASLGMPVEHDSRIHLGSLRVEAGALTQATLFLP